jgi:hypothetical protein
MLQCIRRVVVVVAAPPHAQHNCHQVKQKGLPVLPVLNHLCHWLAPHDFALSNLAALVVFFFA